jgi:hypothetical protein
MVGGGFVIREIALPKVPYWGRIASGVFGVLLLLPLTLTVLRGEDTDGGTRPPVDAGTDDRSAQQGTDGIEVDAEPDTTGDHLRLTGLAASVRGGVPRTGDTITVRYKLTNVANERVRLESTFVGARNPADENVDSEDRNEGRALAPGETAQAAGRILLDEAGTWTFWPCYALPGDRYCPDKWKAFNVMVE